MKITALLVSLQVLLTLCHGESIKSPTEHTSRVWLDLTFQNENASAAYTKAIARFNRNRKILGLVSPDLSLD
ncbi:MAG: hypothetical protein ACSHX8_15620, partial [Opitutaceae bacterium]